MKLPSQLVILGDACSLSGTDWDWTWTLKDKFKLYSSTDGTRLFIIGDSVFKNVAESSKTKLRNTTKAEKLYSKFTEFKAESAKIGGLSNEPTLKKTGRAMSIIYRSDKWSGKPTKYIHEFKVLPQIWCNFAPKPTVLVLSGGKIRVTPGGIRG